MSRKFAYDYYDVDVPRDAIPWDAECEFEYQDVLRIAFAMAEKRARFHAMPGIWTAQVIDDPTSADIHVRVRRKRYTTVRPHFHMLVGMPGYMSDTNYVCHTRGEAEHSARWQAQDFRDQWDCDEDGAYYSVSGNKHDGYEIRRRGAFYPEEVWMTIRITECFEEDCLEELEE